MNKYRLAAGTIAANAAASSVPPDIEPGAALRSTTVPGQMAALLPGFIEAKESLQRAHIELAKWDGASPVRKLDPKFIRRSRWANRSEAEFSTKEFANLKLEIAQAGGNVQPILVRVLAGPTPFPESYEIVYGHRRHQACLELGLLITAQIVESMDDQTLFASMDRENRERKSLSPWEQGCMYRDALDAGLFPSLRRLSESVGVDLGDASRYVQLARLPELVVAAFPSPLDLVKRWAKPLTDAVERDFKSVLALAKEAKSKRGLLDANAVFDLLVEKGVFPVSKILDITVNGKKQALVRISPKGMTSVEFERNALSPEKQSGLTELIRGYLSR